jgi:hypothetical protein
VGNFSCTQEKLKAELNLGVKICAKLKALNLMLLFRGLIDQEKAM